MESPHATAELVDRVALGRERILAEVRKVIVGQDDVIDLSADGAVHRRPLPDYRRAGPGQDAAHQDLAEILDLTFKRIQFTPDLMPSDITGTEVLEEEHGHRVLRFVKGPVFAQIVLADEINRTPPKTQAALLEAMQERHVTAAGRTYELEPPFFVLATQNPIELEGTYPLPEAQLDRFMFNVVMTYLAEDDEVRVVTATTGTGGPAPARVLGGPTSWGSSSTGAAGARGPEEVARYAVRLVKASRPGQARHARLHRQVGQVGRGVARIAGRHSGLEGPRAHARTAPRVGEGRAGAGASHSAAPRDRQLLRRSGGGHVRHGRGPAARGGAGARERLVAGSRWLP
jgi:MoxR-like ATPase